MASDLYSTNQQLAAARALTPMIEAAAEGIDRERRLPEDLVAALKAAGLFKVLVPRSLGGSEASLLELSDLIEETAKADASTAWCLGQNAGVTLLAAFLPRPAAVEIFSPAGFAIAQGQGPARAIRVEGGYRLSCERAFASGVHHATWLACQGCPITGADGGLLLDDAGAPLKRTLVFPRSAAEVIDTWDVSGLRGTGSDTFRVANLFVPDGMVPGLEPLEAGPLYAFNTTQVFSTAFASAALGLARAMLDAFVALAVGKAPRDASSVLREQPTIQVHLAQGDATLRASRAYLREAVGTAWEEACHAGTLSIDARVQLRLATTYAIRQAAAVVDQLYYLAGTSAITRTSPLERRFRDMHAITQHMQGREDHLEPVGQHLMGIEPNLQWL